MAADISAVISYNLTVKKLFQHQIYVTQRKLTIATDYKFLIHISLPPDDILNIDFLI